jgi:hypothetical protein
MFRELFLGTVIAAAVVGGARAEAWYVIAAGRDGATIIDAESRKTDQGVFVTTRVVHPGLEKIQGSYIIASEFREEFDCAGSRFRTLEYALIDVDGHVPPGLSLSSDKIRDWHTVQDGTPGGAIKHYACDGVLPAKAAGPYKDFADFWSKFAMWVDDKTSELEGPRR